MTAIHDTLFRQWLMLRMIPRHPRVLSTQQIFERLRSEGYPVTDRTVARDLDSLSAVFGYTCEESGRSKLWFWPAESKLLDLPGMEPTAALAWLMSRDYLEKSVPSSALAHLAPYFERAGEVLDAHKARRQSRWQSIFRVARRGPVLAPPKVKPDIHHAVSEALLDGRQIKVRYKARSHGKTQDYTLHPLSLVLRHQIYYLVAMANDYEDPLHFALHRMTDAQMLDAACRSLAGFDLDQYVETSFKYPNAPDPIELVLRVRKSVADHLDERPLARDQQIEPEDDQQWQRVQVSVPDTLELRWWIMGFGDQIVVEQPKAMRKEFKSMVSALATEYDQRPKTSRESFSDA